MIDLAIQTFHGENVARLTKIEERIIGIDGNGTGRDGALQRQDKKIAELAVSHKVMDSKLDTLLHRSESWTKQGIWNFIKWSIGIIITLLALVVSYLAYRATQHPQGAVSSNHAKVQTYDAGVDPR